MTRKTEKMTKYEVRDRLFLTRTTPLVLGLTDAKPDDSGQVEDILSLLGIFV